jgi:hypothetical protein
MWRKLLHRCHPDTGGDGDLFIWTRALYEYIAGDAIEPPPRSTRRQPPQHPTTGERIDNTTAYDKASSFTDLTARAVAMADNLEEPYASLLRLLGDCGEASEADTTLYRQQHQGATYKTLAAIAHRAGMGKDQRVKWYRICESVPLSQRHAGHIVSRLQRRAA